jgi:hypothetical protein
LLKKKVLLQVAAVVVVQALLAALLALVQAQAQGLRLVRRLALLVLVLLA